MLTLSDSSKSVNRNLPDIELSTLAPKVQCLVASMKVIARKYLETATDIRHSYHSLGYRVLPRVQDRHASWGLGPRCAAP